MLEEEREIAEEELYEALEEYLDTKTVASGKLEKLSIDGSPLPTYLLKDSAILSPDTREIYLSKVASGIGYWRTVEKYLDKIDYLRKARLDSTISDTYKELIEDMEEISYSQLKDLEREKDMLGEFNATKYEIVREANRARLRSLASFDRSWNYGDEEIEKESKELMMMEE